MVKSVSFCIFTGRGILCYLFHSTWFTFFLCCCQMSINYRFLLHSIPRRILILATLMMWFIDNLKFLILFFVMLTHLIPWFSISAGEFVSRIGRLMAFAREWLYGNRCLYGIAQLFFNLLLPFLVSWPPKLKLYFPFWSFTKYKEKLLFFLLCKQFL
jgi:hypothetical protein